MRRVIRVEVRPVIAFTVIGALIAAGCGAPTASATSPETSPLAVGSPIPLPSGLALIPANVVGATQWTRTNSLPSDFDAEVRHSSPGELADAFGAAIHASWVGRPRPDLSLDTVDESAYGALLIISETGLGDDSVAGSQYALVLVREDDGWRLGKLWTRALCWRGVSGELCV